MSAILLVLARSLGDLLPLAECHL
jgi:hypothetical protein